MSKLKLGIEEPPLRQHMVFTGASILAEIMADFEGSWTSRAEYMEDSHRALEKCYGVTEE
jgi:actin-related protein